SAAGAPFLPGGPDLPSAAFTASTSAGGSQALSARFFTHCRVHLLDLIVGQGVEQHLHAVWIGYFCLQQPCQVLNRQAVKTGRPLSQRLLQDSEALSELLQGSGPYRLSPPSTGSQGRGMQAMLVIGAFPCRGSGALQPMIVTLSPALSRSWPGCSVRHRAFACSSVSV